MTKGKGAVKRPEFVVELVKRALAEKSRSQAVREPGPAPLTVQRSMKGEPTQAALEKLAAYLGVPVPWLRGNLIGKHGRIEFNVTEPTALCAKCGEALQTGTEGNVQLFSDSTEIEGDGILRIWPCRGCCKE